MNTHGSISRRTYFAASAILALAVICAPLISYALSSYGLDWQVMSDVGQSYGSIAAILSGAALIGVTASVSLQSRQTRILAEQAVRSMHLEIMREAWRDPELLTTLEPFPAEDFQRARQYVFLNSYIMYLRSGFLLSAITEQEIEDIAARCFSTASSQFYWLQTREHHVRHFEPRFVEALDRGFARAETRPQGGFTEDQAERPGGDLRTDP